jgi:thiol:disulfide interchange protein
MRGKSTIAIAALLTFVLPSLAWAQAGSAGYDPRRDPERDLQSAIGEARAGAKRIILELGGEWCGWCHLLERVTHEDQEISRLWSRAFVTVKVNVSQENGNERFLARYPSVAGYPHLFVLDSDGQLLQSQATAEFEEGRGYSRERILAFLNRWAPPGRRGQ